MSISLEEKETYLILLGFTLVTWYKTNYREFPLFAYLMPDGQHYITIDAYDNKEYAIHKTYEFVMNLNDN
jgi:hypothetical protein